MHTAVAASDIVPKTIEGKLMEISAYGELL